MEKHQTHSKKKKSKDKYSGVTRKAYGIEKLNVAFICYIKKLKYIVHVDKKKVWMQFTPKQTQLHTNIYLYIVLTK